MKTHSEVTQQYVPKDQPVRGLSVFTVFVLSIAVLGGLVFGLDIGTGDVTSMDTFRHDMNISLVSTPEGTSPETTQKISMFPVVFHVTSLLGAPFAGAIADKYGRKKVVIIASTLFMLGAIWQVVAGLIAPSFAWSSILLGRALGGIGNGFILTIMPMYAAELSPSKYRGQAITFFQLFITFGILIMALLNNSLQAYEWGWRVAISIQVIPCIMIILAGLFVLPDSPQYLMKSGNEEAARAAIKRLSLGQTDVEGIVNFEIHEIKLEIAEMEKVGKGGFLELFQGAGLPAFLCGFMVALSQNVTGVNWLMNYSTILFESLGFDKFLYAIFLKSVNSIATIVALFVIERLGRKFLTLWGTLAVIAVFIIIPTVIFATGVDVISDDPDSTTKAVQLFVVILIFVFQAAFAITWGPLGWLVPGEVFPLRLRGVGMSSAVVANMLTNIVIGDYGYQNMSVSSLGLPGTMYVIVGLNILVVLPTVVYLQPETLGVSMENMRFIFAYEKGGNVENGHKNLRAFFARNRKQALSILGCGKVVPEEDPEYLEHLRLSESESNDPVYASFVSSRKVMAVA